MRINSKSGLQTTQKPTSTHLRPALHSSSFDRQYPFSKRLPYSPRPSNSTPPQQFIFPPILQLPISDATTTTVPISNSQDPSYVPPSPLQLWKISRESSCEDEGWVSDTTDTTPPSCDEDSVNILHFAPSSCKGKVTGQTAHLSTYTTPLTTPPTTTSNIQSVTAKKRGQVR